MNILLTITISIQVFDAEHSYFMFFGSWKPSEERLHLQTYLRMVWIWIPRKTIIGITLVIS